MRVVRINAGRRSTGLLPLGSAWCLIFPSSDEQFSDECL